MVMNMFDLTGKKAIVTGGASGLGRGLVEGLHEAGAEVAIIDITDQVDAVANEICKSGAKAFGVKGNLRDREQLRQAFQAAVAKLGDTVDILVNCAGIQRRNPCLDFTAQDWDDVIEVNLTATFLLSQLAGKIMAKKNKGKIINIASVLSTFGGYTVPAYASTKGGVAQLTKAFSNELSSIGINVNAIAPGYMATPLNTALIEDKERNAKILARIPAARWGTPDDMKGLVVFLASDASNYVNGAIIPVDGGYLGC
ncbi:MAG: 2-deoxy-D-gluconate 3-dehydrogenase [Chloroflexi bacterium HGW-Chloroflexi-5]|nr:MAG: 2-deoxy-D-gluconate 3-dehydrogenase [Deltaproteobacteria bacterium HGW-Deltaproteobacteria-12]PKN96818.1 MAG: 2-deoxy-D-gluconate 3-dehydrogenase [Chloroflexi bacterium HGW-Chloroflexi-5]